MPFDPERSPNATPAPKVEGMTAAEFIQTARAYNPDMAKGLTDEQVFEQALKSNPDYLQRVKLKNMNIGQFAQTVRVLNPDIPNMSDFSVVEQALKQKPEYFKRLDQEGRIKLGISKGAEQLPLIGAVIGGGAAASTGVGLPAESLAIGFGASAGEAGKQLIRRAVGADTPETSTEAGIDIAKEGAGTAAANMLLTPIFNKGLRILGATTNASRKILSKTAERLGVDLTPAQFTGSAVLKRLEDWVESLGGTAGASFRGEQVEQVAQAAKELQSNLRAKGIDLPEGSIGQALQSSVKEHIDEIQDIYHEVRGEMFEQVRENYKKTLTEMSNKVLENMPHIGITKEAFIKDLTQQKTPIAQQLKKFINNEFDAGEIINNRQVSQFFASHMEDVPIDLKATAKLAKSIMPSKMFAEDVAPEFASAPIKEMLPVERWGKAFISQAERGPVNYSIAEKFRTALREAIQKEGGFPFHVTNTGRNLQMLYESLTKGMDSAIEKIGGKPIAETSKLLREMWGYSKSITETPAVKSALSAAERSPENIVKYLTRGPKANVPAIEQIKMAVGGDSTPTWQAIKEEYVGDLLNKTLAHEIPGETSLNIAKFNQELTKLGDDGLTALMGKDAQAVKDFGVVLNGLSANARKYMRPEELKSNNLLMSLMTGAVTGVGALAAGPAGLAAGLFSLVPPYVMSKIYFSPIGRKMIQEAATRGDKEAFMRLVTYLGKYKAIPQAAAAEVISDKTNKAIVRRRGQKKQEAE